MPLSTLRATENDGAFVRLKAASYTIRREA